MRHANTSIGFASLALGVVTWGGLGSTARAQEEPYLKQPLAAPTNAFELQLSTGYTQGFGRIVPNTAINDVAGAGWGFTADAAYRFNPYASLDLEGQYQVFIAENANNSQGVDVNLGVTLHSMPDRRADPWLRVATGWRWIWQGSTSIPIGDTVQPFTSASYTGWDIVNLRIGLDIRTSDNISWAPIVGADLQTFWWANTSTLPTAQWGTFVYAGVQGRFDIGPSAPASVAANRPAGR
jgi:hypothetical protein